jgi:hypothetical protein
VIVVAVAIVAMAVVVMVMTAVVIVFVVIALFLTALALVLMTHVLLAARFMLVLVELVSGRVDLAIPAIGDKVDGAAAGVVLTAVLGPMLLMTRRYVQIERGRWRDDYHARRHGDHGLRQNQLGCGNVASESDLAVEARSVEVYRDTHVAGEGYRLASQRCDGSYGEVDEQVWCLRVHVFS